MHRYTPLLLGTLLCSSAYSSPEVSLDKDNVLNHNKEKVLSNNYLTKYLYGYDFSTAEQLGDWHIEGFGLAKIADHQLILEPEFHQQMMVHYEQEKFSNSFA